ncbi:dynein axonemal assembly factor 3 [Hydra vulgaris]|uniref:Dynein axonemal assembly factor 3 n=1 Tax=Hydra vulgaris TaxID=6087 RepID=A0ABM4BM90_HYDVU
MSDAIGSIPWWGFSPAENFVEIIEESKNQDSKNFRNELNILTIGGGDGRHILKTVSHFKNKNQHLNIYVAENNLELIARQILFFYLAIDKVHGLQEKVFIYLDLFGNTLLRKVTEEYLHEASFNIIKLLTSSSQNKFFDFSLLKFKERDVLEGIFKFWSIKEDILDLPKCWDYRLRQHLGVRYDARENVFDWDYSMYLKDVAPVVNWHEYKKWRETGLAFDFCDSTCMNSNKTLVSGLIFKKDGERIGKRGYWGDMIVSPYITFGVECDSKDLMAKNNNQHIHSSTDICKNNVTSFFHEIHMKYVRKDVEEQPFFSFQLHFLSFDILTSLHKKIKYKKKFDLIYFSNHVTNYLNETVTELFSPQCLLMIESTKYLNLKKEQHTMFGEKVNMLATNAGCTPLNSCAESSHAYYVFQQT